MNNNIQDVGSIQPSNSIKYQVKVNAKADNIGGSQENTNKVQFESPINLDLIESQRANLGLITEEGQGVNEETANKSSKEDLSSIICEEVNNKSMCERLNKIVSDPSDLRARVDAGFSNLFAGAYYLYQRWDTIWTKLKDMGFDLD